MNSICYKLRYSWNFNLAPRLQFYDQIYMTLSSFRQCFNLGLYSVALLLSFLQNPETAVPLSLHQQQLTLQVFYFFLPLVC